jgi:hypothetical protein
MMPTRRFTDSARVSWDVWDVYPTNAERRLGPSDRRRVARGPDRRQRPSAEPRVPVRPPLSQGWLAFESKHEKRRLAPIPEGWESADDAALERLCAEAKPVGKPRRLIE